MDPVYSVDPSATQLQHFGGAMAGKATPLVSVADVLQSVMAVAAVRQSIPISKTIELRDLA